MKMSAATASSYLLIGELVLVPCSNSPAASRFGYGDRGRLRRTRVHVHASVLPAQSGRDFTPPRGGVTPTVSKACARGRSSPTVGCGFLCQSVGQRPRRCRPLLRSP